MEFHKNLGDWYDTLDDRLKGRIDYEVECIPHEKFYFFTNVSGYIDRSNFQGAFAMIDKTKKDIDELSHVIEDYDQLIIDGSPITRSHYNAYFINVLVDPMKQDKTFNGFVDDI